MAAAALRIIFYPLAVAAACLPAPARAQSLSEIGDQLRQMRQELLAQRRLIDSQAQRLAEQQQEIARLHDRPTPAVAVANPPDAPPPVQPAVAAAPPPPAELLPDRPVGPAPELATVAQQVQAVPEGMGVLTRARRFVLEPSLEYANSSNNRLVFRGIELIPGIQIGLIEAGTADRDTLVATATLRYGLTRNLEIEGRVPYLVRSDRTGQVQQQQDTTSRQLHLNGNEVGDIELGLRYQLNRPLGEKPIFVASFRVKSDTGRSPFAVPFDSAGVATGLATGSGFWAVQPGLSFLLPTDPAVIFGGVGYLYHIPRNIDRMIGVVRVGRVDPGDAISGNLGFGFALNPRFSFSLGYEHAYIFPTRSVIDDVVTRSDRLQIGSFLLGISYRLNRRQSLNLGLEFGATEAAPDVAIIVRMPFSTE